MKLNYNLKVANIEANYVECMVKHLITDSEKENVNGKNVKMKSGITFNYYVASFHFSLILFLGTSLERPG